MVDPDMVRGVLDDNKIKSNDGHTTSLHDDDTTTESDDIRQDDPVESGFTPAGDVAGILAFNLDTPEGERRMRECLDAPKWKYAVHEFERWLHDQIKYGDHAQAWIDAYEQARMAFFSIFDDRGIDLWED